VCGCGQKLIKNLSHTLVLKNKKEEEEEIVVVEPSGGLDLVRPLGC
jgi:hypothetical protein